MNKPSKEELDAMLTRWKRNKETAEDHIFLFNVMNDITHWQPLPTPPTEPSNETK